MSRGASMDAISLDEWELLPDHRSSFFMEEFAAGGKESKDQLLFGADLVMINIDHFAPTTHRAPYDCILDEEDAKKPPVPPLQSASAQDPVVEFKDTGVAQAESRPGGEFASKAIETLMISDAEEEEEAIAKCTAGCKEVCEDEVMVEAAPDLPGEEEQEQGVMKDTAVLECVGFSVGNLRVNGVGALCSFGVAAATFCIFLLGGRQQQQHQKKMQNQKSQFQMYADDERIQQVVEQASRLNKAMSSVMGGASSTGASISFGGYYDGF